MAILLDGDNISDLPLDEIVRRAAKSVHVIFDGGERMDYYRNCDVLTLFAGDEYEKPAKTLSAAGIADRWTLFSGRAHYTTNFHALRLGELINWSCQQGIVRPCGEDRWQIVFREMQFELCGPERKQVAVRVRGLTGAAAIDADRIWQRERKRRERARVKRVAQIVDAMNFEIDFISKRAPGTRLPEALARFALGEHDTIVAVREMITAAVPEMSIADANKIGRAVRSVYLPIANAAAEERKRQSEQARAAEEAELAALAAAFPEPPPPPRPEPFPAEVRKETKSHLGRAYRDDFEVEGNLADVERTIEMAIERWSDRLNRVVFKPPVQTADGRWIAQGYKYLGTD